MTALARGRAQRVFSSRRIRIPRFRRSSRRERLGPLPNRLRPEPARVPGRCLPAPTHAEHEAAEDEPPVDAARAREEHRRTEERPRPLLHECKSARAHRDGAGHDERERRIPGAGEVEKAEHLRRIRHPGNEEPEPEHETRCKGSGGIHGRPHGAIRWRATYTVAKPAAMNATVAAIERGDAREMPHTP